MPKITFMGAGSTVFAKNVLGDSMMTPALENSTIALYDIDGQRLNESKMMLDTINRNNGSKAKIEAYLGVEQRKDALRDANYVVNAIQVGLYEPCTVTDFEVPKDVYKRQEEKSEREPLKIWGEIQDGAIVSAQRPVISAQCYRVAAQDGHMAAVSVQFDRKPSREEILSRWAEYAGEPQRLNLPSAPKKFLTYFEEDNRPQTRLDRDLENGMGISIGRLREDPILDYKFVSLSHNTLRGAAGGAVLTAELLVKQGYITRK